MGRGGGQVVSVLAFFSDDPSSNPSEVYNFSVKLLLKTTKINKKEARVGPFKKKYYKIALWFEKEKEAGDGPLRTTSLPCSLWYFMGVWGS